MLESSEGRSVGRRALRAVWAVARRLVPSALRRRLRPLWAWQWFRGDYPNWAAAAKASAGYGDSAILERVLKSTLAVQAGEAAFERDSVLFSAPEPDAPLL